MPIRKRRTRASIHVRLAAGKDQDLITWWETLPTGTGAEVVKRAIREYLESATYEKERPITQADLEALGRWVVEQMRGMTFAPRQTPGAESEGERLAAEQAAERLRKVQARRW